jgi:hypothetical protein
MANPNFMLKFSRNGTLSVSGFNEAEILILLGRLSDRTILARVKSAPVLAGNWVSPAQLLCD